MAESNQARAPAAPGFRVVDRRGIDKDAEAKPPEGAPAEAKAPETSPAAHLPPRRQPIDFTTFVLSLASTALIQMGVAPHPETGKTEADPELARETIDLLGLLREKTRGNLTAEESKFFDALLYDLRLRFVESRRQPS